MFAIAKFRLSLFAPMMAIVMIVAHCGTWANAQPNTREIQWFEDLESAIRYATTNNLPLMLHFYGDNCPPCKLLEQKAYQTPELIGKINASVVAVRINGERNTDLRRRYNVTRWPTDVYLLPNGNEIYRTVSPQDPTVYGKMIERIAMRHRDWKTEQMSLARADDRRYANQTATQVAMNRPLEAPTPVPAAPRTAQPAPTQPTPQPLTVSIAPAHAPPPTSPGIAPHGPIISPTTPPTISATPVTVPVTQVATQRELPPESAPTLAAEVRGEGKVGAAAIAPDKEPTIGLDGFCPVSLFLGVKGMIDPSNCWTEGSPKFAVKHRGRIYLCASEELRQKFLQTPDLYSPCLSGFDLIHYIKTQEFVDGKCEFGCFQGDTGRIFLFANQENCNEFRQKEAFYSQLVNGANQPERVANQPDQTPVR